MRLPSLLFGVATAWRLYRCGRRLLDSPWVGMFTTAATSTPAPTWANDFPAFEPESSTESGLEQSLDSSFMDRLLSQFLGAEGQCPVKKSSSGFQPNPASSENANSKNPKITSKSAKASAHKGAARRTGSKVRGR